MTYTNKNHIKHTLIELAGKIAYEAGRGVLDAGIDKANKAFSKKQEKKKIAGKSKKTTLKKRTTTKNKAKKRK